MFTPRRFTITILVTLIATSLLPSLIVRADERLSDLRSAFYNGRYAEVLTRLYDYREQPYGKQAEVDYMIGSCLCRTGNKEKARRRFEWILSRYRLESQKRRIVEQALLQCGSASRPAYFRESTVTSASERLVGVSGKGGTITRDKYITTSLSGETVAVTSETATVLRDIPPEEFESRLFDFSKRNEAMQRVAKLAGEYYHVQSLGPFIIANSKYAAPEQALTIARGLEKYASFYATEFGIPRPTKFITIYVVSDAREMENFAATLHGIKVSEGSIGYSFPFDLSMVGVVPGTEFGTLAHELFHLMVRNDFGDIPPWLEEGMASLYEVSGNRGNGIAGAPNWRGKILKEFWRDRPLIDQLVKMDWRSFDGSTSEGQYLRRQAINHATARYVMLYLQDSGRLVDVYRAFRQQKIDDLQQSPEEEAARLLASVVRKSLPEFDNDFARWFSGL